MTCSSPIVAPETSCTREQQMCPGIPASSPAFGTLRPKIPLKLRSATATRVFFDSADYQLERMQAREGKVSPQQTGQEASADWRALVKSTTHAEASIPAAHHTSGISTFHTPQMATPGTQPLCRGVHRPSRLSQTGF